MHPLYSWLSDSLSMVSWVWSRHSIQGRVGLQEDQGPLHARSTYLPLLHDASNNLQSALNFTYYCRSQFKEDTGESPVLTREINPITYLLQTDDQARLSTPVLSLPRSTVTTWLWGRTFLQLSCIQKINTQRDSNNRMFPPLSGIIRLRSNCFLTNSFGIFFESP